MQISDAQCGHDLRLCPRPDGRPRRTGQVRQLKAAGCEKVFREKIAGTTVACQADEGPRPRRRGDHPGPLLRES
jgi:hypothetical protein